MKIKMILVLISSLMLFFGCSTMPVVQVENLAANEYDLELVFPDNIPGILHSPIPEEDPEKLVQIANYLSTQLGKHESAAKLFLEVSKFPSAHNQLTVDGLTAACVEFIISGEREGFLITAKQLSDEVENLELEIIRNDQTLEIINFYNYIVSNGSEISPSLSFLFIQETK